MHICLFLKKIKKNNDVLLLAWGHTEKTGERIYLLVIYIKFTTMVRCVIRQSVNVLLVCVY